MLKSVTHTHTHTCNGGAALMGAVGEAHSSGEGLGRHHTEAFVEVGDELCSSALSGLRGVSRVTSCRPTAGVTSSLVGYLH